MKTDCQPRRGRGKGGTDFELMVVFLALSGAVVGFFCGLDFGSHYGVFVGLAGGIVGAVVGLVGTFLAIFLLALVLSPLDTLAERFARWWRPYPRPAASRSRPLRRRSGCRRQERNGRRRHSRS